MDAVEKIRGGGKVTDGKWFEESGHWLQYMLLLNSGNRIQTVVMVTNYALETSFNVLCASDEQRPIQLTRRDLLETEHISLKMEGGKTGQIEINVPVDLAVGLCNYCTIKNSLGIMGTGRGANSKLSLTYSIKKLLWKYLEPLFSH